MLVRKGGERIQGALRFFSVPLLITSLFAPFRQISAGRVSGSLSVQLQAFGDRLFSRVIGAIVRSFLILFGIVTVVVMAVLLVVCAVAWPLLPVAPLIGALFVGAR